MQHLPDTNSVITIDPHYISPGRAAVYLIDGGANAAFVDTNTPRALPVLMEALAARNLTPEQVEYVIVTHLHLDHSAGTAALLQACPNAIAIVHPRGVRHLIAPARLVQSAKHVYGEELFSKLYGEIQALDPARVRAIGDGETLRLGDRTLTFLHTAGHARHHICIHDSGSNGIFTGDTFGAAFPDVQHGKRSYLLCSCPPTEFDAEEARRTVHRIMETGAERAYLTHFGPFSAMEQGADEMLRTIDEMEAVRLAAATSDLHGDALRAFCADRVREVIERQLVRCGIEASPKTWHCLAGDVHMNSLGLAHAAEMARREYNRAESSRQSTPGTR